MNMVEEFQFQSETKQILDLVINSLYTNKDIFLRELISNASDAFDRLRFETLINPNLLNGENKYEIRLERETEVRTLTISDTGIGMSREEVIANIGTIAKSGTRELRTKIESIPTLQLDAEFIGQFGVGFYSAFMVANKVTLVTRRVGEMSATMWESTGDGTYQLSETQRTTPGTSITLHLKPVDTEQGIEDYTDQWVLSKIVKRYSDFVAYPVICQFERQEVEREENGILKQSAQSTIVFEDKILNSMKPIWSRDQTEITDNDYSEFYRHISHDWGDPFKTISLKAEGKVEYQALLFIPSKAPYDLFYHGAECGLRLCSKRVLIMEKCEDLLPRYLRFVKGVVDSADLPLNISRQMLQQDRHITQIRKWLTKKILDTLQDLNEKGDEKYLQFWNQFGRVLKEGVSSDFDNKDRILSLLLFQSSNDPEKLTNLKDYIARMKEEQSEIYYLVGESRRIVENLPHLEALRENGFEVLYLVDPVDELLVQSLPDYESKKLKSVGKGIIELGDEVEKEKAQQKLRKKEEEVSAFLNQLQQLLDKDIKQVRLSNRLISSPACLVGTDMDYSPQLERLLQKGNGGGPKQRRILELNPNHDIFIRLYELYSNNTTSSSLNEYADLLFGCALIAEGSELPDPIKFNSHMVNVMLRTL